MQSENFTMPFELALKGSAPIACEASIDWAPLSLSEWRITLGHFAQKVLAKQDSMIICIAGKPGSGKSTLARQIRKKGLPGIAKGDIVVIDDGTLHLKFLKFFPRRIRSRVKVKDYLQPFAPYLQRKRVLVYANATPEARIDRCDLFVRVRCDEALRRERLVRRDHNGEHRFQRTLDQSDAPKIAADYYMSLDFL